jgi:hypothetical protein
MPKRPGREVQCNKIPLLRGSFTPQTYLGPGYRVKLGDEFPRWSSASLAAPFQNKMHENVNYEAKNGVGNPTDPANTRESTIR